jgi:hypothetical protein
MARGIIGGIVLSTLVTLVIVPVFYLLLEELGQLLRRLVQREPQPTSERLLPAAAGTRHPE